MPSRHQGRREGCAACHRTGVWPHSGEQCKGGDSVLDQFGRCSYEHRKSAEEQGGHRSTADRTTSEWIQIWTQISPKFNLSCVEYSTGMPQCLLEAVLVTLEILRRSKRFHVRMSLEADLGLEQVREKVKDYFLLLHDFPIRPGHL